MYMHFQELININLNIFVNVISVLLLFLAFVVLMHLFSLLKQKHYYGLMEDISCKHKIN